MHTYLLDYESGAPRPAAPDQQPDEDDLQQADGA